MIKILFIINGFNIFYHLYIFLLLIYPYKKNIILIFHRKEELFYFPQNDKYLDINPHSQYFENLNSFGHIFSQNYYLYHYFLFF